MCSAGVLGNEASPCGDWWVPNFETDPCGVLEIDCGLLSCQPKMQLDLKPPQFDLGTQ